MQIEEHSSELGRWRTAQRASDPRLAAYALGYFGSESHLPAAIRERHLPATEVALLVNFASPHRRLEAQGTWTSCDGAWIVGLHDRHQLTEALGEREFLVVRFTPIGAHLFLRLPMNLIANRTIPLEEIDAKLARALWTRAAAARTWAERFDAVEQLIAERVTSAIAPSPLAAAAFGRLAAAGGRGSLGRLATELECSHRHLIAQFQACIGFAPKTIARVLRFNRSVQVLDRLRNSLEPAAKPYIEAPAMNDARMLRLADVALACGYSDQPHFTREFRQFAGLAPTEFLRTTSNAR